MPTPSQKPVAVSVAQIEIDSIHSLLIHPGRGAESPHEINGAAVPKSGKLFSMLQPIFDRAAEDCPHNIAFNSQDGQQKNDCRDALITYIKNRDLTHGREIAKRLQAVTTHRSGLGLLFLITGEDKGETKIVVSRFPADSGVLAEERGKGLTVEFLERIFMKSAKSYKSVLYSGKSSVKQDILAMQTLMAKMPAQAGVSAKELLDQFHVPDETQEQIKERFQKAKSFEESFTFVPDEFAKFVHIRITELDNGALLTAPSDRFEQVFTTEPLPNAPGVFRFSTQGRIVDQRFRKVKP